MALLWYSYTAFVALDSRDDAFWGLQELTLRSFSVFGEVAAPGKVSVEFLAPTENDRTSEAKQS